MLLSLWRRVACVGGALLVAAPVGLSCSGPSEPSPFSNLDGTWSGTYVVAACPSHSNCGQLNQSGPPPGEQPIALTLRQQGSQLRALLQIGGWLGRSAVVEGSVTGNGGFTILGGDTWDSVGGLCGSNGAGGWRVLSWHGQGDRFPISRRDVFL